MSEHDSRDAELREARAEIEALIKKANDKFNALSPKAQAAKLREARISWVYGNLAIDGSAVTKEQVARAVDDERGDHAQPDAPAERGRGGTEGE